MVSTLLDEGFVADCPYAPEAILFEELVEIDREAGRLVARMTTHDGLPFTALQRAHPLRHPPHVSGAVMIHLTGMLGFAHAYYVLGLRHADGWIGYGTHIQTARYGRLATIGPPLLLECRGTRVRRIREEPLRAVCLPLRAAGRGRLRERAGRGVAPGRGGRGLAGPTSTSAGSSSRPPPGCRPRHAA